MLSLEEQRTADDDEEKEQLVTELIAWLVWWMELSSTHGLITSGRNSKSRDERASISIFGVNLFIVCSFQVKPRVCWLQKTRLCFRISKINMVRWEDIFSVLKWRRDGNKERALWSQVFIFLFWFQRQKIKFSLWDNWSLHQIRG